MRIRRSAGNPLRRWPGLGACLTATLALLLTHAARAEAPPDEGELLQSISVGQLRAGRGAAAAP